MINNNPMMRNAEWSQRSEFLVGQLGEWIAGLNDMGRIEYLFELEMWLKCFERYFRVSNQPIPESSAQTLALRSFYEEVGLVANAIRRVNLLCTYLSSEDQVNQQRFDKYVENFLRKGDIVDPYIAVLLVQQSPQAGLTLLRESFEDLQLILSDLTKISRIPYATFQSIGRLIYREIRRNDYLSLLMDKKFKPAYDRISSEPVYELIHRIEAKGLRRLVAKVFLEFFRLLHYLEFTDPRKRLPDELRTTVLIFSLVVSEARGLLDFLRREMRHLELPSNLHETVDRFIYCVPLELKKVIDTELIDLTSFKQADSIYVSIENSHGILRDAFQESVIQLAQVFEPNIQGTEIFDAYATKLERSLLLRRDLIRLIRAVYYLRRSGGLEGVSELKDVVATFRDRSLRFLMYRDWASFDMFHAEIERCDSRSGLVQIAHRFETYLRTLLKEVSKRAVLQGVEWERQQETLPGPIEV